MNPDALLKILETGMSVGIIGLDAQFRINLWNGWMEKKTGIPARKIMGSDLFSVFADIESRNKAVILRMAIENRRPSLMSPMMHQYLIPIDVERDRRFIKMFQNVRIYPVWESQDVNGLVIIIEDMTEQIIHEREILRLNELLKGLRTINDKIANCTNEFDLYTTVSKTLVDDLNYTGCTIGHFEESGIKRIFLYCNRGCSHRNCFECCKWSQLSQHFDKLKQLRNNEEPYALLNLDHTPCNGKAAYYDCKSDDRCKCKMFAVFPIEVMSNVIGVMVVGLNRYLQKNTEELDLLNTISSDISYCVASIRNREKHKQTQTQLSESKEIIKFMEERARAEVLLKEKQAQIVHSGRLALLGEMASGMAHELNQPLSIIRLTAEKIKLFVKKGTLPEDKQIEEIERIMRSIDRAAAIIQHMRDFARKKNPLHRQEPIDPVKPVNNSLIFFKEQFRNHDILLETDITELPKIRMDPQQLEQVLVNFLSNARYALDIKKNTGGVKKKISIKGFQEHSNHCIIIEVSDNGAGMPPEVKERCLEPFFTTKEAGEGTGLGLSIAYNIIKEFNGEIEVDSKDGAGTAMRIKIPFDKEQL